MKKLLIIIIILSMILVGMIIYRNRAIGTKDNITVEEINNIQEYISNIYMWKEVTEEALPTFDNINEASDLWVWEVVNQNSEDYEIKYEDIQQIAKRMFGQAFEKEFPKERNRNDTI